MQELLEAHPDLVRLEDLGLTGPTLIVGRESVLNSGRIELMVLANGGELVFVEFKTSSQHPDFRGYLAQLLDCWRQRL